MTSKEALNILHSRAATLGNFANELNDECYKMLQDDLEVLEILKDHLVIKCLSGRYIICDNLPNLSDYGNEEDFAKVKEWLERN